MKNKGKNKDKDKSKSKSKDKSKGKQKKGKKGQEEIEAQIASKKQDRLTKREMRRRKQQKHDDEWKVDLMKFRQQLADFGVAIKEVGGDGNCLFRSLADQVEGLEDRHATYRQRIVQFFLSRRLPSSSPIRSTSSHL